MFSALASSPAQLRALERRQHRRRITSRATTIIISTTRRSRSRSSGSISAAAAAQSCCVIKCDGITSRGRRERTFNNNERRETSQRTRAMMGGEGEVLDATYPVALLLGLGVGYGIARIIVYARLQYIAAKFLTLRVFQPEARVLEYDCGNSGRNLYYYPKNVKFVTYKGPEVKGDLLGQISVQAEIPVQIEPVPYEKSLSGMREESMDAVVSTGAFTRVLKEKGKETIKDVLKENARVLKENGQAAMIFIEPKSDELVEILNENGRTLFNPMEVDEKWETLPLFPYLIGTMTKREGRVGGVGSSSSGSGSKAEKPKSELQSIRSRRKPKK